MRPAALIRGPIRKPRSYAVMPLPSPQPATSINARKPGFATLRQILQTDCDNRAVFADEFRDVGDCSDRHNLHKRGHLRLTTVFPKQRVYELESDADTGEILIRIFATNLVRIEHRESGRRAFFFIGQVMIGDDYVETVVARPVEWFVSANATVDTDDEFVTVGECFLERRPAGCRNLR